MSDDVRRTFEAFVRRRGAALSRSAFLLTGDIHRAEDVVQQALADTYGNLPRLGCAGDVDAFARRAVVNASLAWQRRRSSHEQLLRDMPDRAADDQSQEIVDRDAVVAALQQLPKMQRAAIILRYYDDASEAETAAALGCSVGSVKTHTSRGLARLKELLATGNSAGFEPVRRPAVAATVVPAGVT